MNFAKTMLLITGIAALSVTPSLAQSSVDLKANVPWAFNAGNTRLPAGEYVIKGGTGSQVVRIQNVDTKQSALLLTMASINSDPNRPPVLLFHKYGDKCYLSSVTMAFGQSGREFGMTKSERETAKAAQPFTIAKVKIVVR
jgi:hypothetical protein